MNSALWIRTTDDILRANVKEYDLKSVFIYCLYYYLFIFPFIYLLLMNELVKAIMILFLFLLFSLLLF